MTVSTVRSQDKDRHQPGTRWHRSRWRRRERRRGLALDASGPGSRLVYCALAEPAKAAVRGLGRRRAAGAARGAVRGLRAAQAADLAGDGDARTRPPGHRRGAGARGGAAGHRRGVHGRRGGSSRRPAFQEALARRGLTDMSAVHVDAWPAAYFGLDVDSRGGGWPAAVAYLLDGPHPNPYARPIENLVVIWDRDAGEIVELQDGRPGAGAVRPRPLRRGRRPRRTASWPSCGSCSRTAPGSPSTTGSCAGARGSCGSRCTRSRAWCCTRSPTSKGCGRGRSCSARRWRRWSCPTARPR